MRTKKRKSKIIKNEIFPIRFGLGYDVHRLVKDRKLILGGVQISSDLGLLGHSDADVLLHSICDSLLGAAALGDIGKHFPDTDMKYYNISSIKLLEHVAGLIREKGFEIGNVDSTVILESPKIGKHIKKMCGIIAKTLKISISQVSIKATTNEKIGALGRKEGCASFAVSSIIIRNRK